MPPCRAGSFGCWHTGMAAKRQPPRLAGTSARTGPWQPTPPLRPPPDTAASSQEQQEEETGAQQPQQLVLAGRPCQQQHFLIDSHGRSGVACETRLNTLIKFCPRGTSSARSARRAECGGRPPARLLHFIHQYGQARAYRFMQKFIQSPKSTWAAARPGHAQASQAGAALAGAVVRKFEQLLRLLPGGPRPQRRYRRRIPAMRQPQLKGEAAVMGRLCRR